MTQANGKLSRRDVAKVLALGGIVAALPEGTSANAQPPYPESGDSQSSLIPHAWTPFMPGIWRARIGLPEAFTPTGSRSIPPVTDLLKKMPPLNTAPIERGSAIVDRRGTTVFLPLAPGENLFGLGLQMYSLNQRGKKKTLRVNADPPMDTGDSHAPAPFYVSSLGYGIFVDTARYATFCCGTTRRVEERNAEQHPGNTSDLSKLEAAPTLEETESAYVTVQVDGAKGVDVYLFGGPTMIDAVRRYVLFSGGGVNPPEWGLGVWYRTQENFDSEEVIRFGKEFRERKIPCDVLGLEPGWQTQSYSCSFVWSKGFPNPAKFVQAPSAMNYKVNLWEHAFVHPTAPFHDEIAASSGDYLVWKGLVPDFQREEARRIFGEYHRKNFIDIGVSGFKLDECDNSDFTDGWSFPEFAHFPSGQDGEQMHSVFGLRYQEALLQQFNAANTRTYGLVRSSGALAAPYPFVLYSDLYDHRVFVRSLVNSGFSGLLWCPEVREARNGEDLIRRLQTAVFSPLALINCSGITNPPWKQPDLKKNNANQLEPGWEALEARCREVLGWRMMLLPYLRATFARYLSNGTPPFRALVLDDPSDSSLVNCDDQFLVGDRMMVAPLFEGESTRAVILPRGEWHDFWTGKAVAGGQTIEISASYARIPVYVKAGSVMPMGGIATCTEDPTTRVLTVRVFGDGSLPFSIEGHGGPELTLSWRNGKGTLEQRGHGPSYSVAAWEPAAGLTRD
jgi:alpha-D-xyloside xylohydrolase